MTAPVIDVSTFNGSIDWARARAAGIQRVIIRGPIGEHWVDDRYRTNWSGAAAAGIPQREVYADVLRTASAHGQFLNLIHQTGGDMGTGPVHLDVERTDAERAAIRAGTLVWDKASYTAMLFELVSALQAAGYTISLYTSRNEWLAMTTDPAWARGLAHWIAHYNAHISQPDVPDGWAWDLWQYGQAPVDGIAHPVDVSRERVTPMISFPIVPRGSLAALYAGTPGKSRDLCAAAAAAGRPYPSIAILNDSGLPKDIKAVSPTTLTFWRMYDPLDDSLQGLDDWSTLQREQWVGRVLNKIYQNVTTDSARYIDWACAWNEEDPPGPQGYQDLGETFLLLIEANEQRRAAGLPYVKLALGTLAQGTPELWEMQQLVDTGLYARMRALGYAWVVHEGVFRKHPISEGYNSAMPSTPANLAAHINDVPPYPGSGAESFRFVWLFERLLRPRGQLVPLFVGEWYDGGVIHAEIAPRLGAWSWYDDLASQYEYFCGFAGFAGWLPGWASSDLSDVYESKEFDAWRAERAGRQNGANEMQPLYHATVLQDLALRQPDGSPAPTIPIANPPTAPGLCPVVPKGRLIHVYAENVTAGALVGRVSVTPDGLNVWGVATALVKV